MRRCLACLLLACAGLASAAQIEVALRIPFTALEHALAGPDAVYRDGACRQLRLEAAKLEAVERGLRLTAPAAAGLGLELPGGCHHAASWQGTLQATLAPQLDARGRLRVRVIDSNLPDLAKPYLHPRLEHYSVDIAPLRGALLQSLNAAAPPEQRPALEAALAQLRFLPPRVEPHAVVLPIALEVPDAWLAPAPLAPVAPLTPAELDALERALEPLDAFLVYSIKQVALERDDGELRRQLFSLLLDSRYRLSAILAGEETPAGDPLRALFIDAWSELRALLAGQPDPALRYAAFLDAGDALLALDRAAPGLGMRVSADGLRQLARALRPGATADPLVFDWAVDRELRGLFEVEEIPDSEPPRPRSWLDFLVRPAYAERLLDRWVPTRVELDTYQARIGELLHGLAAGQLKRVALAAPYDAIYAHLVPATALIESCWRQYTLRGGKVTYVRSGSGSVGIMQINQRVWRGFYDVERLRWNTAYNARAGAQILMRYLRDYAIPYAAKSGRPQDAPRAAYAVYNAGPRAVGRFARPVPHPREKRVDDRLWSLYQGLAAGRAIDLRACAVESADQYSSEASLRR